MEYINKFVQNVNKENLQAKCVTKTLFILFSSKFSANKFETPKNLLTRNSLLANQALIL